MVTSGEQQALILESLGSSKWADVVAAVEAAGDWMNNAPPGDHGLASLVDRLEPLAEHPKWEVRRVVARVAEHGYSEAFDRMLAVLTKDANVSVRSVAASSVNRRKDRRRASLLGQQHADRVAGILNDIESHYGIRVREAAQRAAEDIGSSVARELYHEVARLLTPLALSVARVRSQSSAKTSAWLSREFDRIDVDLRRISAVLKAMREYASPPRLNFSRESIAEILEESAELARTATDGRVGIVVDASADAAAVVARPRLCQALRNVLSNALEAYSPEAEPNPVRATVRGHLGYIVITVEDRGAGMSREQIGDARRLFVTTKENGTGFGLPLAIGIVESEHNGRLEIESQLGVGTRVKITIPTEH